MSENYQERDNQPTNIEPNHNRRELLATALTFEEYRDLCDQADCFRKVGIQESSDQFGYEAGLHDPRTVFMLSGGRSVPVLMPIEYEARYNMAGCQEMTGAQNVMLLAIPGLILQDALASGAQLIDNSDLNSDFSVVVEDYDRDNLTSESKQAFADSLAQLGPLVPCEFVDDRLLDLKGHQTAWMGIYGFTLESKRPSSEIFQKGFLEDRFNESWRQYKKENNLPELPDETFDGAFLFNNAQLQANPEIVDRLWDISEVGFGEVLGKNHPISMAVTKNFFDGHVTSDTVFTCVRYDKGTPVCFGFFAPNMNHNDWLNLDSTLLKSQASEVEQQNNQMMVHFFELISKGMKGLGLSSPIIELLYDVASRVSNSARVIYESTNYSAPAISYICESIARQSSDMELVRPVESLDTVNYWYMKNQR